MNAQTLNALKVVGMVALVVLPGGSLVLLAIALHRAWKKRMGPFARVELARSLDAPRAWLNRVVRLPFTPAHHRA